MGARSDYAGMDTYDQIQACLKCNKPECDNCACYARKSGQSAKREKMEAPIVREIGLGKDPCIACNAKLLCQANGWTCNAKARWQGG